MLKSLKSGKNPHHNYGHKVPFHKKRGIYSYTLKIKNIFTLSVMSNIEGQRNWLTYVIPHLAASMYSFELWLTLYVHCTVIDY